MADPRYLAVHEDEAIIRQRHEVCNLLRGFSNSPHPSERRAYDSAHRVAEEMLKRSGSDTETVRRHDGDKKALPWFQYGSLYYFEIILAHVTGSSLP